MAIPASFDWKQYYTSVAIDPATESQVDHMARDRKELESITRDHFMKTLHKLNLFGDAKGQAQASQVDMSALGGMNPDSELIPTDYEGQKEYYKNRKRKYGAARVPVPELAAQFINKDGRLLDAIAGKFDEALLDENAQPLQSLTKTYITMMENEGSDGDNWDRALEILFPEKEDK
jgi:hypothetical protein